MTYIFMDESGCLGFDFTKPKTSQNFILTLLIATNPKPLEKLIKKTFARMKKTEIKSLGGVLHAHKMPVKSKLKILKKLDKQDFQVVILKLNKHKVKPELRNKKQILYNYITNVLLDRIFTQKIIQNTDEVVFNASQRETNKLFNQNFSDYLQNKKQVKIQIQKNHQNKCLQIVDLLSWSAFKKYEFNQSEFYQMFKSKIISESELFK